MTAPQKTDIARPSVASLLLQVQAKGEVLSTATGFVVQREEAVWLVTNWHVLSGRRPDTHQPMHPSGAVPDSLVVAHNGAGPIGRWVLETERLLDNGEHPLWIEHPKHPAGEVDVAALRLTELDDVQIYPYDPWNPGADVRVGAATPLSIVGFPFGLTGGGAFGVWVQGTVATEPALDFGNLPAFLIDSRTRPGQSGSPVLAYHGGGMVPMDDGGAAVFDGPVEKLVGVYSGRINEQSDLGFVWKTTAVQAVILGAASA